MRIVWALETSFISFNNFSPNYQFSSIFKQCSSVNPDKKSCSSHRQVLSIIKSWNMRCHSIFAINKSCDFTKTRLEKIPVSMEANKKKKKWISLSMWYVMQVWLSSESRTYIFFSMNLLIFNFDKVTPHTLLWRSDAKRQHAVKSTGYGWQFSFPHWMIEWATRLFSQQERTNLNSTKQFFFLVSSKKKTLLIDETAYRLHVAFN